MNTVNYVYLSNGWNSLIIMKICHIWWLCVLKILFWKTAFTGVCTTLKPSAVCSSITSSGPWRCVGWGRGLQAGTSLLSRKHQRPLTRDAVTWCVHVAGCVGGPDLCWLTGLAGQCDRHGPARGFRGHKNRYTWLLINQHSHLTDT